MTARQKRKTIRPQPGPQTEFLSTPADIAIYGGSAGGGKTWAAIIEPLRHVHNPHFGAVVFRRTSPQITNEGGAWDEAGRTYPLIGAAPRIGDLEWIFPSGACVSFRHLQHEKNKYDWQGAQVPLIVFDELTHFSESQFFYLFSRNRSTCGVRPYIRATVNPDASSWVKRFLAPWIDRRVSDPARSGEVRWFVRVAGQIEWRRSPEAIAAEFPGSDPKSCTFIRASIYDNRILLEKDPGYLANLKALPDVERRRLLDGDWEVVNEGLVYTDFGTAVVERDEWPERIEGTEFGGIDWGWNNPFGALKGTLDHDDVLWIEWRRYGSRITLTEHSRALPRGSIRWYGDPAGADQIAEMRRAGHDVVPCVHLGQSPLVDGIGKVADRIRTGRLKVRGDLGELIEEAGKYRYDPDKYGETPIDRDNHLLAALRYMIVGIDRGRSVQDAPGPIRGPGREEAEQARALDDFHGIDADHWWGTN